jgi:hypothetical protein
MGLTSRSRYDSNSVDVHSREMNPVNMQHTVPASCLDKLRGCVNEQPVLGSMQDKANTNASLSCCHTCSLTSTPCACALLRFPPTITQVHILTFHSQLP